MSLILTEKRGHIAILTLNRPDAMNALGAPGDGDQVAAACAAINADREVPDGIVPAVYVFWQRNDYGWERLEVLEA